ncbi:MAG TPA: hypothetical protein VK815_04690 [Candidatus Acidoferrales bacterium]|nr:hypothetical protein [Candidatus Acidoferrales bacterium]
MKKILLTFTLAIATLSLMAQPVTSASKTSFTEVTSQLDPGGNFYLYLGTAQWLEHLTGKIEGWRKTFTSFPDAKPEDVANINKAFDIITRLTAESGIEDISGFGISSIEIEKGMYRNKALLHHYPGKGTGFLWKLIGNAPHPLDGLDLLPADTALAIFSDANLPLVWSVVKDQTAKAGFPEAQKMLDQLPAQFEQATKLKWDDVLHSLGGEFGLVVTLDPSNNVPIPLPSGLIQIPDPALFVAVKVNDSIIFDRIAEQLKSNQGVITYETNGLKMRTMPVPMPLAINLRPSAGSAGGWLFIASSDAIIVDALAVKAGQKPGLKSTAEFKHLAQGLPETGNQFTYMSARFGATIMQIQKQALTASGGRQSTPAQAEFFNSLFSAQKAEYSYSVGQNTPTGCYTIGNGSQSGAALVMMPAVAMVGMMSAIAIPNFVKARTTAQENACINNLRQLDAAENQWALEKGKKTGDPCTAEDLKPYVRLINGQLPKCPAGGVYTISAVGEVPTCSVPGHALP